VSGRKTSRKIRCIAFDLFLPGSMRYQHADGRAPHASPLIISQATVEFMQSWRRAHLICRWRYYGQGVFPLFFQMVTWLAPSRMTYERIAINNYSSTFTSNSQLAQWVHLAEVTDSV
jgi:hypothetical protein